MNLFRFIMPLMALPILIHCERTTNAQAENPGPYRISEITVCGSPDTTKDLALYAMIPPGIEVDSTWVPADSFSFPLVMKAISELKLKKGMPFLVEPTKSLSGALEKYIYVLDVTGFTVTGADGWDPVVEPGGVLDNMWHTGRRQWIAAGTRSSAKNLLDMYHDSTSTNEQHILNGNFAVSDHITLSVIMDINGAGPGETAVLPLFSEQVIEGRVASSDSLLEFLEIISDVNNLPGQVITRKEEAAHILQFRFSFVVQHNCYFRLRAKTIDGKWIYSNPLFVEPRPTDSFATQWRIGNIDASSDEFSVLTAPVETMLSGEREPDLKQFPNAVSRDGCPSLEISFTVPDSANYLLFTSLNPGVLEKTPEDLTIALNDNVVNYYLAFNSTDFPGGPKRFVLFKSFFGTLLPGHVYRLRLYTDAAGDGIELDYIMLVKTGFPVIGTMSSHVHANLAGDFGFPQARSLGYNLIITAEPDGNDLRRLWRVSNEAYTDDNLLVRPGYELADCFADQHIGALFINAGPGLFPADRYALPAVTGRQPHLPHAASAVIHSGGFPSLYHPHYIHTDSAGVPGTVHHAREAFTAGDRAWRSDWTDDAHHGSGCWSHDEHHEGYAPYYWHTLPLFSLYNWASGENLDGMPYIDAVRDTTGWYRQWKRITHARQFREPGDAYWGIVEKWNDALTAYVRKTRPSPLFAMGDLDAHPYDNAADTGEFNCFRRATVAYLPALLYESFESSVGHGNSFVPVQNDNMLLVSILDEKGDVYLPGNHIVSRGPLLVKVIAWGPKPISELRLHSSAGIVERFKPGVSYVEHTFRIRRVPTADWFRVEFFGDTEGWGIGGVSNPFFVIPEPPAPWQWTFSATPADLYRYHAERPVAGRKFAIFSDIPRTE